MKRPKQGPSRHNAFLEMLEELFEATRPKLTPSYPYDERTNKIELPAKVEKELLRLLSTGNKAEAVKRVTRLTGAGLRISKDYVDKLAKTKRC
jgi:ribosomal protein L7/L12